jgi:tetratricopeptide (TPR) repeat protein
MKGMHGVCLHPGQAIVELKVRVYNRTPFVQTFLWWANVATRVHEAYQSFFPPDVYCVADHARRSMSEYPLAKGFYYGVNYGERGRKGIPQNEMPNQFVLPHCQNKPAIRHPPSAIPNYSPNDLSFYANIPVPTSYMCMGSKEDFFGGYDFKAQAGIVHIADHHISPGKKQWTWGNHEFGYAWDRNLTDKDSRGEFGPYIEIMAGVYTDNQPDFSFLQPGETKTWSQFWYPIQKIGPSQHANLKAALSLNLVPGKIRVGVAVTRKYSGARIILAAKGNNLFQTTRDLAPNKPFTTSVKLPPGVAEANLQLRVMDKTGREIIAYQPKPRVQGEIPPPAAEPPAAGKMASADELFITGLHLDQYRHATRCPTLYWREALRRDPLDSRCNNAMGLWHLKRGEFVEAEKCFCKTIERLARRNANPYDGEAYYNLGLCLRHLGRNDEAHDAFYKCVWNQAWQSAGYHALAELDCGKSDWLAALGHLDRSLRLNTDNLRARNLKAIVLRELNCAVEAEKLLCETLALDPLDGWARYLTGQKLMCGLQTALDLAHDFAHAGFYAAAVGLLEKASAQKSDLPDQSWGALPLVHYTLGWLHEKLGDKTSARKSFQRATSLPSDYCFPARLEEIAILEAAIHSNPRDAKAPYYLGNLFYDRRRHQEAIRLWEKSAKLDPNFSIVWRNLGIGYFNIHKNASKARTVYDKAFRVNPADARLLLERDQLWKRLGEKPEHRQRELGKHPQLVAQRDDLSVEFCALLNQTAHHVEAMQLLAGRNFQPWEGGEGGPLGQHVRTRLALGRQALAHQDYMGATGHFENALTAPRNLGEAKHLLTNQSDIHYWLGCALDRRGLKVEAKQQWRAAANFKSDFQEMSVRAFSKMTYYSALSWEKLGQMAKAKILFRELLVYAQQLQKSEAKIDYFATSLPTMMLFDDDLKFRQETTALFLQAQAWLGLGQTDKAKALLKRVLHRDPSHSLAADFSKEYKLRDSTFIQSKISVELQPATEARQ